MTFFQNWGFWNDCDNSHCFSILGNGSQIFWLHISLFTNKFVLWYVKLGNQINCVAPWVLLRINVRDFKNYYCCALSKKESLSPCSHNMHTAFSHSMTGSKQLPVSAARTGGDLLSEIFSIRDCDVLSLLHSSEKQGLIIKYLDK